MGKSTPLWNCNPWKFHLETLPTWCKCWFQSVQCGFSPNRRNINTLWLFWLSCPVLFLPFYLDPTPRSNRLTDFHRFSRFMAHTTCFRARMVLFWGLERQGNMPPKLSTNDYPNEIQYGCRRSSWKIDMTL